jgi:hypothetical protein
MTAFSTSCNDAVSVRTVGVMTNHKDSVSPVEIPAATADVRLLPLASQCAPSGTCPTVYQTDRQTIVVQGYALAGDRAGVTVPEGELLVEIPAELLLVAADQIRNPR